MTDEDMGVDRDHLRRIAMKAGDEKAVNYGCNRDLKLLMVWDAFGKCRVYSVDQDNLHWSVPLLDKVDNNFSLPV